MKPDNYKEPESLKRAMNYISKIYDRYTETNTKSYKEFINYGKGDLKDSGHTLRLVHDGFLQDAFKNNCIGTIYRSEQVKDSKEKVHCEHVIPNNLLVKYIFHHLKPLSLKDLAEFIYKNRIICSIPINEKEKLNTRRKFNGKKSKWASKHPDFDFDKNGNLIGTTDFSKIQPFKRYEDTGIEVYNIFTEERICKTTFTMQDHYEIIAKYQHEIKSIFNTALNKY